MIQTSWVMHKENESTPTIHSYVHIIHSSYYIAQFKMNQENLRLETLKPLEDCIEKALWNICKGKCFYMVLPNKTQSITPKVDQWENIRLKTTYTERNSRIGSMLRRQKLFISHLSYKGLSHQIYKELDIRKKSETRQTKPQIIHFTK